MIFFPFENFLNCASSSSSSPGTREASSISFTSYSRNDSSRLLSSLSIFDFSYSSLSALYALYVTESCCFLSPSGCFAYSSSISRCFFFDKSDWCSCCPWISRRQEAAAFIWLTVQVSPLILLMLLPSISLRVRRICPSSSSTPSSPRASSARGFSTWNSNSTSA